MKQPWFALGRQACRAGEAAPDFDLPDGRGQMHRLSDYQGKWLLLYFYPRDNTPLCTREACGVRDNWGEFSRLNAAVLGISLDSEASHQRFAATLNLPFPLLSDISGDVAFRYGALLRLGPLRLARRFSFLIDPQGGIRQCYFKVQADKHAGEVVDELKRLQTV